jgi:hypothetical protein
MEERSTGKLDETQSVETVKELQRRSCLHFFELVVFMIGFLMLVSFHEDISRVHEVVGVVEVEITKPFGAHSHTFHDVRDVTEIWEWLREGLIPSIVTHKDAVRVCQYFRALRAISNIMFIMSVLSFVIPPGWEFSAS